MISHADIPLELELQPSTKTKTLYNILQWPNNFIGTSDKKPQDPLLERALNENPEERKDWDLKTWAEESFGVYHADVLLE